MINVSKLKKGIVIDHITAGRGYKIFRQLGLDKLDDVVVLMKNVDSTKLGRKDLIKIETDLKLNFDVLGLIDPGVTVTYIENGKSVRKMRLEIPKEVVGILECKNPRCISREENITDIRFKLVNPDKREYACEFCEARTHL